jgi:PAS domain S-box-containing protein
MPVNGAGGDLFRLAIEAAPTGMIVVDQDGTIALVNARVEALFGYSREQLVGRSIDTLVPSRIREGHPSVRRAFFADPRARPMGVGRDLFALRSDGVEVPVEIGLTPFQTSAGKRMVVASVVDITERRRAQQAAEASLREKELLLREVHHRVKNNLQVISSLLKLHADTVTDPAAQRAFRDSQHRVRSIALLHEKLCEAPKLTGIDLDLYCRDLVHMLMRTHGEHAAGVKVTVAAEGMSVSLELALPCGLILNELVTNAVKHAFVRNTGRAPSVRVSVSRIDQQIEIVIADNGVGLPVDFDFESAKTLGTHLVRMLSRQLGATLEVGGTEGTRWTLRFAAGVEP